MSEDGTYIRTHTHTHPPTHAHTHTHIPTHTLGSESERQGKGDTLSNSLFSDKKSQDGVDDTRNVFTDRGETQ